jgi:hypothetical protein
VYISLIHALTTIDAEHYIQKPPTSGNNNVSTSPDFILMMLQKNKVVIWLYDNIAMRIEGRIVVSSTSLG